MSKKSSMPQIANLGPWALTADMLVEAVKAEAGKAILPHRRLRSTLEWPMQNRIRKSVTGAE